MIAEATPTLPATFLATPPNVDLIVPGLVPSFYNQEEKWGKKREVTFKQSL